VAAHKLHTGCYESFRLSSAATSSPWRAVVPFTYVTRGGGGGGGMVRGSEANPSPTGPGCEPFITPEFQLGS
jgi:hypothetical protein